MNALDEPAFQVHGFITWVWGIGDGMWSLPDTIPESVLRLFIDGTTYNPISLHPVIQKREGPPRLLSPSISWRCEDCKMAMPFEGWAPCPVCGSHEVGSINMWNPTTTTMRDNRQVKSCDVNWRELPRYDNSKPGDPK